MELVYVITYLIPLAILASSIWVGVDASKYRERYSSFGVKGPSMSLEEPKPGDRGSGPGAWVFACLVLWIVAFPMYWIRRNRPPVGQARRCSKGHVVADGQAFCAACGEAINRACPNGHVLPREASFCPTCGAPPPPLANR